MKASFTIPGRLAGMNDLTNANRTHWAVGAKLKKDQTKLCALAAIAGNVPEFKTAVMVDVYWFEKDLRRDIDNISGGGAKFLMDGLVESGRLPNDTRKWVKSIAHFFPEPDKKNPRVVVEIRSVE